MDGEHQATFAYDFICPTALRCLANAELITVADGLVVSVELLYDAKTFEKLAQRQAA